ncbi:palmitoyltransferase ZDHHC15-like [Cyclospora cayetanensis]|uniref:Palmitoyltransferase n=1 Tax=Cyclospora cayetanensis TaxID=88456 RepID=A0A6P6S0R2_9EIME|nr:palmitoyltransferase ZDHHC15-like [Cyclospora cayetanensis]
MIETREHPGKRLARFLPMIVICSVMAILYTIYLLYHCLPMFQVEVPPEYRDHEAIATGALHFFTVHVGAAMVLWSFYKTYSTEPGRIPGTNEWQRQPPPNLIHERKRDGGARYCHKCSKYKPDRCHHSSNTGRCVLKMDHYCPWVANDVGFFNYKFFFLTLLYSGGTLTFVCTTMTTTVRASIGDSNISFEQVFFTLLGTALSFFLLAIVLPFCIFHCWLIATNCTTIEFCEKRRTGKDHPYDVGTAENFTHALGEQPLWWLLPVGGPSGNGIIFPRSR